jgi:hypothetical protein
VYGSTVPPGGIVGAGDGGTISVVDGSPIIFTQNASSLSFPKIAAVDNNSNNVYVVWNTEEVDPAPNIVGAVFFAKSSDRGNTFGDIKKLNNDASDFGEA